MAELRALEIWAGDMLAKMQPVQRLRLLVDMARRLRTLNAHAQADPDGAAWVARKPPGANLSSKREKLRQQARQGQPMFAKLRQQKHLKARAEGGAAVVTFAARAERIARVHHFGLSDPVMVGAPCIHIRPARC